MKQFTTILLSFLVLISSTYGFVTPSRTAFQSGAAVSTTMPTTTTTTTTTTSMNPGWHPALLRQRKSMATIQTQSLFGLGAPELAVILIAAAFFLGPQKLADLGKDAGKIAGELKEVPKEFQKGLKEGEREAANALKSAQPKDAEKEE